MSASGALSKKGVKMVSEGRMRDLGNYNCYSYEFWCIYLACSQAEFESFALLDETLNELSLKLAMGC